MSGKSWYFISNSQVASCVSVSMSGVGHSHSNSIMFTLIVTFHHLAPGICSKSNTQDLIPAQIVALYYVYQKPSCLREIITFYGFEYAVLGINHLLFLIKSGCFYSPTYYYDGIGESEPRRKQHNRAFESKVYLEKVAAISFLSGIQNLKTDFKSQFPWFCTE